MTDIASFIVLMICTCTAIVFVIDSLIKGKFMWTMAFLSLYVINVAMYFNTMLR